MLVNGANGGVGTAAVQIASVAGASVLATVRDVSPVRVHDSLPTLMALWTSVARDERLPALLAHRHTRVYLDGTPEFPVFDAPDAPPVLLGEGQRGDVFARRTVAVVGTHAALWTKRD